jgi:hypothetical protein
MKMPAMENTLGRDIDGMVIWNLYRINRIGTINCPTRNEHKNTLKFSQSEPSHFGLELRKNALLISQSAFSNFAIYLIKEKK